MESLFFWVSKVVWAVISPDTLLVIAVVVATGLLWSRWLKTGRWLLTLIAAVMVAITFIPFGSWMLLPLENRFMANPPLPQRLDGVIALTGAENPQGTVHWNQVQLGKAAERLHYFQYLARRYPEARLLFTGGSGMLGDQIFKEADVARRVLLEQGIDVGRVIFERDSRNTAESIRNSLEIIRPQADEKWAVITTAWHMPRTIGIFCRQGWPVIPYPVDYATSRSGSWSFEPQFQDNLSQLRVALKEWVGLLAYFITGKTDSLLPQECR
ncbi:MAG: YdcF family protein [Gammaproteobacteria bacterium]|nr:YdcF family protein [Gammaproteobacteria bacterium]